MNAFTNKFHMVEVGTQESQPNFQPESFKSFQKIQGKPNLLEQTKEPSGNPDLQPTRSRKKFEDSHEISFQSSFLQEHTTVFDSKLENFIESICECSEKIDERNLKSRIFLGKDEQKRTCDQILQESSCPIKLSEKLQFKVDLMHENYFKEFLDYISGKLAFEIASEFITVANFIWQEYMNIIDERLNPKDLKAWGRNIALNKFQNYKELLEKTQMKLFLDDEEAIFPNFEVLVKEFMTFYMVTLVLTIEQFFQNPFLKKQSGNQEKEGRFKRFLSKMSFQSDNSEDQMPRGIFGGKIRKIEF